MNSVASQTALLQTPVGLLRLMTNRQGRLQTLKRVEAAEGTNILTLQEAALSASYPVRWLFSYFKGEVNPYDASLELSGLSPFRRSVLEALQRVAYAKEISYKELAEMIGRPDAIRAVANALASNPIWIVIPCHRVVRSDGTLGGYAGGIGMKKALLAHEKRVVRNLAKGR